MMKYLLQVYLPMAWWEGQPLAARATFAAACHAHAATLAAQGHLLAAQTFEQPSTTLVRGQSGEVCVSDGPFTALQAYLVERYLIDARDLNHALAMAAQMPQVQHGVVEVVSLTEVSSSLPQNFPDYA